MLEAQETRRVVGQPSVKSDLSGLETRLLKKRKVPLNKVIPIVKEPQPSTFSPSKGFRLSSPKKMKTLMSGEVYIADWEISSLMCETNESDHTRSYNEFKFWSNNFNGLTFLYDHLNSTDNMNKVKTIGRQKLTQNIRSYLMRCVVLICRLFEVGDECEQNEIKLNKKVT